MGHGWFFGGGLDGIEVEGHGGFFVEFVFGEFVQLVLSGELGVAFPLFEEDLFEAFFAGLFVEFCFGGDGAVGFVEDDFVYGFNGLGVLRGFGEVRGGDLECVEEEAGAAGVDLVEGDALDDLADGGLDGGAVFGEGEVEGGLRSSALADVFHRAAGLVVVVAEIFVFERAGAAAMAVGEDVAALEDGCGRCDFDRHVWGPPSPVKYVKYSKQAG